MHESFYILKYNFVHHVGNQFLLEVHRISITMHCHSSANDLETILDFLNNCLSFPETQMPIVVPFILQCGDGEICFGCGNIITDRYLLKVNERAWHVACLRCRVCNNPLDRQNSCFVRDDNIYCKLDYSR